MKKETKSDRTRALIVEKSASLFNRKGFHGTSLSDIMEATGLTKGGIYGNFKREGLNKKGVKEEIALAAFEYNVNAIEQEISMRTHVINNTADKLKAVIFYYKEKVLNYPVEGGCPLMNTAIDADDNVPNLLKQVKLRMASWHDRIVYTINKGIKKGELVKTTSPEEFATYYIGTLEGGILLARLFSDNSKFETMATALVEKIEAIKI